MMIAFSLGCLFAATFLFASLSLLDSGIVGVATYRELKGALPRTAETITAYIKVTNHFEDLAAPVMGIAAGSAEGITSNKPAMEKSANRLGISRTQLRPATPTQKTSAQGLKAAAQSQIESRKARISRSNRIPRLPVAA